MTGEFHEAVTLSLFTNSGWWGNELHLRPIGSEFFKLLKERHPDAIIQKCRAYCKQALQWTIDEGHCEAFEVRPFYKGYELVINILFTMIDGQQREMIIAKGQYEE